MVAAEGVAPAERVLARGSRQLSLQPGMQLNPQVSPLRQARSPARRAPLVRCRLRARAGVAAPGGGAVLSGAGEEQPLTAEAIVSANNPAVALSTIVRPMFCFTTPL